LVSKETDPSVLVNGHFDSPLGSPGAGDCGSCVGELWGHLKSSLNLREIIFGNSVHYLEHSKTYCLSYFPPFQHLCWKLQD